jgi:opacity protein-like surface antigen
MIPRRLSLTRRPIGFAMLLVAMSSARSFAGPDLPLEPEPASGGVDLAAAFSAAALQDLAPPDQSASRSDVEEWRLHLVPAFWVPIRVRGTVEVGSVSTEVDLNANELFDGLDFAIEGGLALSNGDWSLLLYASYFKLGVDVRSQGPLGTEETSMDYQMTIVDCAVGKRIGRGPIGAGTWRADLLAGLRYWDHKIEIDQTDPVGFDPMIAQSADWIDAFVGGRIILDVNEDVALWFRGDVGGFSIGSSSELTWTLTAMLELELSDTWSLVAGYRYVDVDWETGIGPSRFKFDYEIHGPIIGASIRF